MRNGIPGRFGALAWRLERKFETSSVIVDMTEVDVGILESIPPETTGSW